MNKLIKAAYETMGTSSYVSVTCPPELELVHYQLETLLSNQINNLLAVSKQLIDGETVIYYNITSQIPLSQVLEKRKLKRKELLNLIEGIISAIEDASAYRLPAEGIMLEPDYLYVNPASCKPSFLYLPLEQSGEWGVKELIAQLIMHDQIELANDNLIQVLLKELNRQPFSLSELEKSLKQYSGGYAESAEKVQKIQKTQAAAPQITPQNIPAYGQAPISMEENRRQEHLPIVNPKQGKILRAGEMEGQGQNGQIPAESTWAIPGGNTQEEAKRETFREPKQVKRPEIRRPGAQKPEKQTAAQTEQSANTGSAEEFDKEKAKKMFLLPQALIMVIVAAGISFGLFVDKTGKIAVNNILALVIVIVLTEVILYREIYINRKQAGKTKAKKAEKPKKANTPGMANKAGMANKPALPKPSRPGKPGKTPPVPQSGYSQQSSNMPQPGYAPQSNDAQPGYPIQPNYTAQPDYLPQSGHVPLQAYPPQPGYPLLRKDGLQEDFSDETDTDLGSETELWGGMDEEGASAYLEYYEDNRLIKIPLNSSGSTMIGRLESQVDFAVKNPKVGKVHAKFYGQGNQFFVVDINSKNGTYINGSRTRIESNTPCLLHDQDRISLADAEFIIRCAKN